MKRESKSISRRKPVSSKRKARSAESVGADFPLVLIAHGSDADGYNACARLLEALVPDPRIRFVVVSSGGAADRRDPLPPPTLRIPCKRAQAKEVVTLEPGTLYMIPPGMSGIFSEGALAVSRSKFRDETKTADELFQSACGGAGGLVVGIVLSGKGSDGAQGILALKAAGGICIAQEPERDDEMARAAIATGCIDFTLPPERIAEELTSVAYHPFLHRAGTLEADSDEEALKGKILSLVFERTQVDFSSYKNPTILRRIQRRMVLTRQPALSAYIRLLEKDPREIGALYQDFLVNVTQFFRDPELFLMMKQLVFPQLFKARSEAMTVRIWVPACSTGEEVYSIAINLLEYMAANSLSAPIQVFGTDINEAVIERARTGIYGAHIAKNVTPERLARFFNQTAQGYQIKSSVRELCVFARQNVLVDPPFSRLDMVSCRNLLIYLTQPLQMRLIPLFHYALRSHGYLILGNSEVIGEFSGLFGLEDKRHKIYSKKAGLARPPGFELSPSQLASGPPPDSGKLAATDVGAPDYQKEADRVILESYSPPGAVVNESLDILQFRGRIGTFLSPTPGRATLNLLKMVPRELALEIRTCFHAVKRSGRPIAKDGVKAKMGGKPRWLRLHVTPLGGEGSREPHYLVLFEERPIPPFARADGLAKSTGAKARKGEEERLHRELSSTREYLQSIIEDREASHEELQAANEEILSSNEELQSINQELETAKEELQSTNEELTTVNDELQHRLEELKRSRDYVSAILQTVSVPLLVLDADLRVKLVNRAYCDTFQTCKSEVEEKLLSHLGSGEWNVPALLVKLEKTLVLDTPMEPFEITQEFPGVGRKTIVLNARRVKFESKGMGGVLLALENVTELRRTQAQIQDLANFPSENRFPVLRCTREGIILYGNPACRALMAMWVTGVGSSLPAPYLNLVRDAAKLETSRMFEVSVGDSLFEFSVVPVPNRPYINLYGFDVTDRARVQHALREGEERFRLLVDSVKEYAIFRMDPEGVITSWNEGARRIKGYQSYEVIGKNFSLFYPAEERDAGAPAYALAMASVNGSFQSEGWRIRKDGSRFFAHVTLTALRNSAGGLEGFAKVSRDITEKRLAEESLRRNKDQLELQVHKRTQEIQRTNEELQHVIWQREEMLAQLETFQAAAPVATAFLDSELRYCRVNESFLSFCGLKASAVLGRTPGEVTPSLVKILEEPCLQVLRTSTRSLGMEHLLEAHGSMGERRHWFFNYFPVRHRDGKILGVGVMAADITDRILVEQELRMNMQQLAQSNSDLERFAYVASHDLKEPLRMVTSYVRLLQKRYHGRLDPDADQFIAFAVEGASRMYSLIDDLLSYSRLGSGSHSQAFTSVNLNTVFDTVSTNLHISLADAGAKLTRGNLPTVQGDEAQLGQVFQNLVSNALKFRGSAAPVVRVEAQREGSQIVISVADNGIGIAPEYKDKIFVLFQRLHSREDYPGTGIGLAICKRIVERHGGRIWVASTQGEGSTFYFSLPLNEDRLEGR